MKIFLLLLSLLFLLLRCVELHKKELIYFHLFIFTHTHTLKTFFFKMSEATLI
jgi:hypothetical protein